MAAERAAAQSRGSREGDPGRVRPLDRAPPRPRGVPRATQTWRARVRAEGGAYDGGGLPYGGGAAAAREKSTDARAGGAPSARRPPLSEPRRTQRRRSGTPQPAESDGVARERRVAELADARIRARASAGGGTPARKRRRRNRREAGCARARNCLAELTTRKPNLNKLSGHRGARSSRERVEQHPPAARCNARLVGRRAHRRAHRTSKKGNLLGGNAKRAHLLRRSSEATLNADRAALVEEGGRSEAACCTPRAPLVGRARWRTRAAARARDETPAARCAERDLLADAAAPRARAHGRRSTRGGARRDWKALEAVMSPTTESPRVRGRRRRRARAPTLRLAAPSSRRASRRRTRRAPPRPRRRTAPRNRPAARAPPSRRAKRRRGGGPHTDGVARGGTAARERAGGGNGGEAGSTATAAERARTEAETRNARRRRRDDQLTRRAPSPWLSARRARTPRAPPHRPAALRVRGEYMEDSAARRGCRAEPPPSMPERARAPTRSPPSSSRRARAPSSGRAPSRRCGVQARAAWRKTAARLWPEYARRVLRSS